LNNGGLETAAPWKKEGRFAVPKSERPDPVAGKEDDARKVLYYL